MRNGESGEAPRGAEGIALPMISARARAARQNKLERLRSGKKPRVLEICSGCGGLSLGLLTAGFELSAHIEIDPEAAESYAVNFGGGREASWARPRDKRSY
jgi:DNA (cytosine-5)-methyltransferase 1